MRSQEDFHIHINHIKAYMWDLCGIYVGYMWKCGSHSGFLVAVPLFGEPEVEQLPIITDNDAQNAGSHLEHIPLPYKAAQIHDRSCRHV